MAEARRAAEAERQRRIAEDLAQAERTVTRAAKERFEQERKREEDQARDLARAWGLASPRKSLAPHSGAGGGGADSSHGAGAAQASSPSKRPSSATTPSKTTSSTPWKSPLRPSSAVKPSASARSGPGSGGGNGDVDVDPADHGSNNTTEDTQGAKGEQAEEKEKASAAAAASTLKSPNKSATKKRFTTSFTPLKSPAGGTKSGASTVAGVKSTATPRMVLATAATAASSSTSVAAAAHAAVADAKRVVPPRKILRPRTAKSAPSAVPSALSGAPRPASVVATESLKAKKAGVGAVVAAATEETSSTFTVASDAEHSMLSSSLSSSSSPISDGVDGQQPTATDTASAPAPVPVPAPAPARAAPNPFAPHPSAPNHRMRRPSTSSASSHPADDLGAVGVTGETGGRRASVSGERRPSLAGDRRASLSGEGPGSRRLSLSGAPPNALPLFSDQMDAASSKRRTSIAPSFALSSGRRGSLFDIAPSDQPGPAAYFREGMYDATTKVRDLTQVRMMHPYSLLFCSYITICIALPHRALPVIVHYSASSPFSRFTAPRLSVCVAVVCADGRTRRARLRLRTQEPRRARTCSLLQGGHGCWNIQGMTFPTTICNIPHSFSCNILFLVMLH